MRYAIASDIHGSALWCKRFLEKATSYEVDGIILLGDILYHGPRNDLPEGYAPKEVIALLNPLADKIYCCRGNCEAEVDQMVLDFPCLGDYTLLNDNGHTIFATHGHIYNPDKLPKLNEGATFLYGHTHVKANEVKDGIHIFNPGSVSIPKDGSHSFGIWDNAELTHIILD